MPDATRRALAALPFALIGGAATAAIPTPRAAEGPYYPAKSMRFADDDNDLIKIEGEVRAAGGEPLMLTGRVLSRSGAPSAGAVVEIWQCDANGRYLHTGERASRPRDPAFQGFGRATSDGDGRYSFRTIKPVAYPGRTPHIHVKVLGAGLELTTQLYLTDHPLNERDILYRRLNEEGRKAVELTLAGDAKGWRTTKNIVI